MSYIVLPSFLLIWFLLIWFLNLTLSLAAVNWCRSELQVPDHFCKQKWNYQRVGLFTKISVCYPFFGCLSPQTLPSNGIRSVLSGCSVFVASRAITWKSRKKQQKKKSKCWSEAQHLALTQRNATFFRMKSWKVYPAQKISQEFTRVLEGSQVFILVSCISWYSTGPPVHHQSLLGMVQAQEWSRPKNFSVEGRSLDIKSRILIATQAAVRRGEGAWLLMRQKGQIWWKLRLASGHREMGWDGFRMLCHVWKTATFGPFRDLQWHCINSQERPCKERKASTRLSSCICKQLKIQSQTAETKKHMVSHGFQHGHDNGLINPTVEDWRTFHSSSAETCIVSLVEPITESPNQKCERNISPWTRDCFVGSEMIMIDHDTASKHPRSIMT